MKKKLLIILITIGMLLPLSGCGKSYQKADVSQLGDDYQEFMSIFEWYRGFGGSDVYDSKHIESGKGVLSFAMRFCVNFNKYPGPEEEYLLEEPSGNMFGCYRYDGEKTEWIMKNIFNYSDSDIKASREVVDEGMFYYHEGSYYASAAGVGGGYIVYPLYAEKKGNQYRVWHAVYGGDGYVEFEDIAYCEVENKKLKGSNYWTLSYWSKQMDKNAAVSAKYTFDDIAGIWQLENDGVSTLNITEQTDNGFKFDLAFFRIVGLNGQAYLMNDGHTLVFDSGRTGITGYIEVSKDKLLVHTFCEPTWSGKEKYGGEIMDKQFTFIRGE